MQRVRTGIADLDEMLAGGFVPGHSVLVAGAPGTGKTSLGLQFLYNGITRFAEPGLFVSFEEFPEQIYRDALNFEWDLRELERQDALRVLFTSPELLSQDIQRDQGLVTEMIRKLGAKRVVVDSISCFQRLIPESAQFRETIYGLINALKREGLTSLLIRELAAADAPGTGAEDFLTDVVIFLTRSQVAGQHLRSLEIVKSRGSRHDPAPGLLLIGEAGLEVIPANRQAVFSYQDAVSVGHPKLDALLGGGIPYGAFYLVELSALAHRAPLELSFLQEALAAGDICVRLSGRPPKLTDLFNLAAKADHGAGLKQALQERSLRLLHAGTLAQAAGTPLPTGEADFVSLVSAFGQLCDSLPPARKVRLLLDLTDLACDTEEAAFFDGFHGLLDTLRQSGGVGLAFLIPEAIESRRLARLRASADGLVRIWDQGAHHFLQVAKSANSVRTQVYTLLETPQPPFFRLASH